MKKRIYLLVVAVTVAVFVGTVVRAMRIDTNEWSDGHKRFQFTLDGRVREYVLYVPPGYHNSQPMPLVVMLHGMGGTAWNSHTETSWSAKAAIENFIVAYPEATRPNINSPPNFRNNPQAWNDGSGRFHASQEQVNDVEFICSMLDRISADYNIDDKRIYVTGFSNGASMAFRVGAELTDRIAAISPNAGACWIKELKLTGNLSLCYITGTADKLNPLPGGYPTLAFGNKDRGGKTKPPVQETIDKWVEALGCTPDATSDTNQSGVRTRRYSSHQNDTEVLFITVEGLGHHWAGGTSQVPEFLVGKNTDKIQATDLIWDFFVAHPQLDLKK